MVWIAELKLFQQIMAAFVCDIYNSYFYSHCYIGWIISVCTLILVYPCWSLVKWTVLKWFLWFRNITMSNPCCFICKICWMVIGIQTLMTSSQPVWLLGIYRKFASSSDFVQCWTHSYLWHFQIFIDRYVYRLVCYIAWKKEIQEGFLWQICCSPDEHIIYACRLEEYLCDLSHSFGTKPNIWKSSCAAFVVHELID